jgi:hypothetical protein
MLSEPDPSLERFQNQALGALTNQLLSQQAHG